MKFRLLFLFFVSLICSCYVTQQAKTNFAVNSTSEQKIEKSNENKSSEIKKTNKIDDSRFSSLRIYRTDEISKVLLKINVEYPQLKKTRNQSERDFNQYVKKQVDKQILHFKRFLVEKNNDVKPVAKNEYEINLDYKVDYYSNSFVSVLMNWNGYSGYLNADYFPSTINFDLKNGKPFDLKDLFDLKPKYLDVLSQESRKILNRTCLSCGCGNGITAGEPLPENLIQNLEAANSGPKSNANPNEVYKHTFFFDSGTEAKEENYNNWSATPEGLKITFDEYQIGPGCIGIIYIAIPYKSLQPILRKDLNFS